MAIRVMSYIQILIFIFVIFFSCGMREDILLIGIDNGINGTIRSDLIMIVSIQNWSDIKVVSILRDMALNDGRKFYDLYHDGNINEVIDAVNEYFKLDLKKYVLVTFQSFVEIIDELGGVEISISPSEMREMNRKLNDSLLIAHSGTNINVNGIQALAYCRLRKTDSDYIRTMRQRKVIYAALKKIQRTMSCFELYQFACNNISKLDTNISFVELTYITYSIFKSGFDIEQFRIPVDGTYDYGTVSQKWYLWPDYSINTKILHDFLNN